MKINLSVRMKMIVGLVPDGITMADIGTDHGYVASFLVKEKKYKKAIATDVNEGPIKRAKKNIEALRLTDKIETRLGDGLTVLNDGEVETVVIAGMGGMLICGMLSESMDILKGIKTLVLQPQSDIEEVRRHLHKIGFKIERESICMEDGKFYIAIRAVHGEEDTPYTDTEYRFSRILAEEGGTIFRSYMRMMTDKMASLLETLDAPGLELGERATERKEELKKEIKELKESFYD